MSWLLAAGYVLAGALLVAAARTREDPRIRTGLGPRPRRRRSAVPVRLGSKLPLPGARARARELLGPGAGPDDVDLLLGRKAILGAAGAAVALLVASFPGALAGAVVLAAGGFALPTFLLARREAGRRVRMTTQVSEVLDLVALGITAGLTPRLAFEAAAERTGDPLGPELRRAREAVALGVPWTRAVLATGERLRIPELLRLGVALERAARLGAPVEPRLRALARDVRTRRWSREEERARRAPVLMLFPLVFLILPAFVIAAVVPAMLVATRGLG